MHAVLASTHIFLMYAFLHPKMALAQSPLVPKPSEADATVPNSNKPFDSSSQGLIEIMCNQFYSGYVSLLYWIVESGPIFLVPIFLALITITVCLIGFASYYVYTYIHKVYLYLRTNFPTIFTREHQPRVTFASQPIQPVKNLVKQSSVPFDWNTDQRNLSNRHSTPYGSALRNDHHNQRNAHSSLLTSDASAPEQSLSNIQQLDFTAHKKQSTNQFEPAFNAAWSNKPTQFVTS
jgi:hypothetical protein